MRTSPMCNPLSFRAIPELSVFGPFCSPGRVSGAASTCCLSPHHPGSGHAELRPVQLQLPARVASALQKPLCPPVPRAGAGAVGWNFFVPASPQALPGRPACPKSGALAWLSQASDTPPRACHLRARLPAHPL